MQEEYLEEEYLQAEEGDLIVVSNFSDFP